MSQAEHKPWYRHLWPWLLMIPPGAAVVGGFSTAYLAGPPPALVVDDYGQIAMVTERRLARDQRARELGLTARIDFSAGELGDEARIRVVLEHRGADSLPPQLDLQLVHPTMADLDVAARLMLREAGYHGVVRRPAGRLYVHLTDVESHWRLVGTLPAGASSVILLPRVTDSGFRSDP